MYFISLQLRIPVATLPAMAPEALSDAPMASYPWDHTVTGSLRSSRPNIAGGRALSRDHRE